MFNAFEGMFVFVYYTENMHFKVSWFQTNLVLRSIQSESVKKMERRAARVSEAQWSILLDFLKRNPSLARARGYNNSARGRAESSRLWTEATSVLNAEGSGTTKSSKDWAIYVSNYKSKLKKMVADINTDATTTGGGPPQGVDMSNTDTRFLAIMGPGFGQSAPRVSINPFPEEQLPIRPCHEIPIHVGQEVTQEIEVPYETSVEQTLSAEEEPLPPPNLPSAVELRPAAEEPARLPQQTRRRSRYHSRPLAPLDEARRILSQVEMQRAAADENTARALHLIGQNLGRLADAAERYLSCHSQ